jgi:hypothetical protein
MESAYADLVVAFHESLSAAQSAARSDSELRQVDAVFETALPVLQQHLAVTEPHGWSAGLSGAFVHGGNRYEANSTAGNCEIADLLVVVEVRRAPAAARTAILLQAKKPMEPPARPWSDGSGPTQFDFYERTPKFTWRPAWAARYYQGRTRQLSCSQHASWIPYFTGTQWADPRAVFAVLRHPRPWVVPPHEPMSEPALLAAVLADLVRFQVGHPFQGLRDSYSRPLSLQWSAVIWDLLQSSSEPRSLPPDCSGPRQDIDARRRGSGGAGLRRHGRVHRGAREPQERASSFRSGDDFPGGGVSIVRLVFTAFDS